jgi:hypothetical protein
MLNSKLTRRVSRRSEKRRLILVLCMVILAQLTTSLLPNSLRGQVTQAAVTCVSVNVPGTSDPWLAGMPNGSTASGGDVAPNQSPVQLTGVTFAPGDRVSIASASGTVSNGPSGCCPVTGPEGNGITAHIAGAENGISDIAAPINGLIGVFLGPDQPNLSPAPPALDFSTPASRDFTTLSPQLKQVFFIGDGVTSGGVTQNIIVPAGATRLFLGTMDGFGWFNNIGAFSLSVCVETPPPPPPAFDICLQDNTRPDRVLLFNSNTGAYRYCCEGLFTLEGVGKIVRRGDEISLSHITPDRRVTAKVTLAAFRGTASALTQSVQFSCEIEDFNIRNNTCVCPATGN